MKVVFVAIGQEQLAISILSAVLRRAGHDTALVFDPALFHDRYYFDIPLLKDVFNRDQEVIDEIAAEAPDLIAFSVLTVSYTWCVDIARAARERLGVPVIFGGVHPSAVPDVCLEEDCVDYVCVGEGEVALVRLCDALEGGAVRPPEPIPNLWWRDGKGGIVRGPAAPFEQDLDALPLPDKELWEDVIRIQDNYLMMTARGCPYRCTFCFNNFFAKIPGKGGGRYVRQRSVENVMNELLVMKDRYHYRHVQIEDDIFTLDKAWIRAFLSRYEREIGVPFSCLVHAKFIDHDLARWLKEAGCDRVQMGIQSADPEYKRKQLLRMEKDIHLSEALDALVDAGLTMKLDHILGLPGEPRSAQELARELFVKYPPAHINTFWLTHLPGIDLTKDALAGGHISAAQMDDINHGKTGLFRHLDHWQDRGDTLQFYQRYDLLFRTFPLLPKRLRERARAEWVPELSSRASNAIGFVFDFTNAMLRDDAESWIYAKHYAFHLARALPDLVLGRLAPPRPRKRRPAPPRPAKPPPDGALALDPARERSRLRVLQPQ